jgi:hypothetical protein
MRRVEEEIARIRKRSKLCVSAALRSSTRNPWSGTYQIVEHLVKGEKAPYDFVPEDDGLRPYLPVIREMIEEGMFDKEVEEDSS